MRAFFGTYTKACRRADELLFQAGNASAIDEACHRSPVGKLLPDDLYVHKSALGTLEPLLRVYEGCGRAYLGDIEGANIIKIHRRSGKISYILLIIFIVLLILFLILLFLLILLCVKSCPRAATQEPARERTIWIKSKIRKRIKSKSKRKSRMQYSAL
jgi:hypothetical protein